MIFFLWMSQESNTTSDTNPKPRLTIAHGSQNAPPPSPDIPATGASPHLSFARRKRAEETPAQVATPVESSADQQLKRPPPGTRLVPTDETATPQTPTKRGPTSKAVSRGHLGLWIALFVLVAIIGGESYFILTHEESVVAANSQKPALLVNTDPGGKPYEVVNDGAQPPTPAYGYLLALSPQIASGNEPRLFINEQTFHIGQIIAPDLGLKWIRINDEARELEFVDKQGRHYIKKF